MYVASWVWSSDALKCWPFYSLDSWTIKGIFQSLTVQFSEAALIDLVIF